MRTRAFVNWTPRNRWELVVERLQKGAGIRVDEKWSLESHGIAQELLQKREPMSNLIPIELDRGEDPSA
jgi:hypothetical protein